MASSDKVLSILGSSEAWGHTRMVVTALALISDEEGISYTTETHLSSLAHISPDNVSRSLMLLQDHGDAVIRPQADGALQVQLLLGCWNPSRQQPRPTVIDLPPPQVRLLHEEDVALAATGR